MNSVRLLQSRLRPSATAAPRLRRHQLQERLARFREARVIVVEAPAGYGKSSLLLDMLRDWEADFAWYAVRDDDADGATFLTYLLEAIFGTWPDVARRARALHADPEPVGLRDVLTVLLNDVLAYERPMRVVLDDVHLAGFAEEVREALRMLCEEGPPNLHLYLASRRPLDLPLARLRSQQLALSLGPAELRLQADEVEALFAQVWGYRLERDVVEALTAGSGGWITALILLHLALERHATRDLSILLDGLHGSSDFIFAYLAEEVLRTQTEEVQDFLKETSLLETVDAEAAAFASGRDDAAAILAGLEREGMFVTRLQADTAAWRYHHLLEQFLREALAREVGAEGLRERHLRLARWYRERDVGEALAHGFAAGAHDETADLLEQRGRDLIANGWHARVSAWLEFLPETLCERRPALYVLAGSVSELRGDWIHAMRCYETATQGFRAAEDRAGLADVLERMGLCLMRYGDWDRVRRFTMEAAEWCPPDDLGMNARLKLWHGALLVLLGEEYDLAYDLTRAGHRMGWMSGEPEAIAGACISHGFTLLAQGRFDAGLAVLHEGIVFMEQQGNAYMAFHMRVNSAVLHAFHGSLQEANALLDPCDAACAAFAGTFAEFGYGLDRAILALEAGDEAKCADWLERLAPRVVPWHLRPFYHRTALLLHARQGNEARAKAAAEALIDVYGPRGLRGLYGPECLLALACWQGWEAERHGASRSRSRLHAIAYAERALEQARRGHMRFWEMKASACLAWLRLEEDPEAARAHLAESLDLAAQDGFDGFWRSATFPAAVPLLALALDEAPLRPLAASLASAAGVRVDPSAQSVVEICTLGGLRVVRDGIPVPDAAWRRKVLQLCKLMISSPNFTVIIDEAVDLLWPDSMSAEKGRHSLRVHVGHLRDVLEPDRVAGSASCIRFVDESYRLEPSPSLRVDWLEFEARLALAEARARGREAGDPLEAWLEAAEWYGGDFLPEEPYADWARQRRDLLRERWHRCLLRVGDWLLAAGRPEEALPWFRRLRASEATSESACGRILQCHAALDDRAAALLEYQEFARVLRSELGLEPSRSLQDILRQVMEGASPSG